MSILAPVAAIIGMIIKGPFHFGAFILLIYTLISGVGLIRYKLYGWIMALILNAAIFVVSVFSISFLVESRGAVSAMSVMQFLLSGLVSAFWFYYFMKRKSLFNS